MARILYKNTWASQNSRLDQQRADLFKVTISLPAVLGLAWTETVEFAVEKFPFPNREINTIETKYMQQTNLSIGGDVAMSPTDLTIRYAFAQRTGEALEKWFQLIANMRTGGVGLTSEVKSKGYFRWIIPNMARQVADLQRDAQPGQDTLKEGLVYELEGVWPRALRHVDADMTQGNTYANYLMSLQIDRYYPNDLSRMVVNS